MAVFALASSSSASPTPPKDSLANRDLKTCNNNLALVVLKALKATSFCSDFLDLKSATITGIGLNLKREILKLTCLSNFYSINNCQRTHNDLNNKNSPIHDHDNNN